MGERTRRIRWPALAAVAVLVAGSGTAYAVAQDPAGRYRTVRAAKGDVEQVLSTSGTVDAAHRADLAFGTSGTVASVAVAVGDTVKAGQVVARLDSTSLRAAVTKAEASVATAEAQLQSDEDTQVEAVSSSSAAQQTKPRSSSSSGSSGTTAAAVQQVKQQQAAVVTAQSAATAAIAAAKDALTAQTAACADAYQGTAPTNGSSSDSADAAPAASSAGDTACANALALVQARQADVSAAQDDLQKALDALAATLGKALAGSAGGSGGTHARSRAASSSADSSGSGATSAASAGAVSAARLAADQAGIAKARAELVDAQQQLGQAVLRSTRSGRVVSVPVSRGDRVSSGDLGAVVVGGTAVVIRTSVPESKIAQVKAGQAVRVTTPGQTGSAEGTVTATGLVADTSTGTATYPVTVTVEDPTISLPAGSQALLGIVVAAAHDVVTVPTSAITRRGAAATVRTWDGHALTTKAVTVGIVGAGTVQVSGGLSAGDEVVLADLDQAITGASDSVNDRGGFTGPPGGFNRIGSGGPPGQLRPVG